MKDKNVTGVPKPISFFAHFHNFRVAQFCRQKRFDEFLKKTFFVNILYGVGHGLMSHGPPSHPRPPTHRAQPQPTALTKDGLGDAQGEDKTQRRLLSQFLFCRLRSSNLLLGREREVNSLSFSLLLAQRTNIFLSPSLSLAHNNNNGHGKSWSRMEIKIGSRHRE